MKLKVHYSWIICFTLMLTMFCTLGLGSTTVGVYFPYVREAYNFTNEQTSMIASIRLAVSVCGTFFIDKYNRIFGIKKGCIIALLSLAICFGIFGSVKTYPAFCIAAIFDGLAYTAGGMVFMSAAVAKWFKTDKATAIGIISAGSGVSSFVAPPAITLLITKLSLKIAFFTEALFIVLIAIVCLFVLKELPEDIGLTAYDNGKADADDNKVYTSSSKNKKMFWVCIFAHIALGVPGYIATAHIANLYSACGMDPMLISALVSCFGLSMMTFKFIYGRFVDKFGVEISIYVFGTALMLGNLFMCFANTHSLVLAIISSVLNGVGLPVCSIGITSSVRYLFNSVDIAKDMKYSQMALMAGGIAGTYIPGVLADKFGSYIPGAILGAVFGCVYIILMAVIFRKK